MDFNNIDFYLIFDIFLLLLIGMGPKIALVPFLDLTKDLDADTQKKIGTKMVRTGVTTALLLVLLGGFLMRLLHFTPGAVNVAGGIVLLLLALHMLVSPQKDHANDDVSGRDLMQMAVYPLAVPYMLNPAGIASLVILSNDVQTILTFAVVIGVVLLVGALDLVIFRNMDKLAKHLDPSRLAITEAVFGVLLAALAVQLMVDGLAEMGVVNSIAH